MEGLSNKLPRGFAALGFPRLALAMVTTVRARGQTPLVCAVASGLISGPSRLKATLWCWVPCVAPTALYEGKQIFEAALSTHEARVIDSSNAHVMSNHCCSDRGSAFHPVVIVHAVRHALALGVTNAAKPTNRLKSLT
jgi:hypothetical protein